MKCQRLIESPAICRSRTMPTKIQFREIHSFCGLRWPSSAGSLAGGGWRANKKYGCLKLNCLMIYRTYVPSYMYRRYM